MMLRFLGVAVMFFSFQATAAYYKAIVSEHSQLNFNQRTHFLVASRGNDLGYLPQLVAVSRALKIADIYPEEQVVVIIPVESETPPNEIKRMGISNIEYIEELLNSKQLMNEMSAFSQIASFHTFGHAAIVEGVFLDAVGDKDVRWYPNDAQSKRLIGHFTEDAFATMNGCNNGHQLAPYLSRLWKIPVSGALTGTHFEAIYDDGKYYWFDEVVKKSFARNTGELLSKKRSCFGACYRMRPDNHQYKGHYGKYQQGLPFFKFFCGGTDQDRCLKAMAQSLLTQTSTQSYSEEFISKSEFAHTAREWLCPSGEYKSDLQKNCMETLEKVGQLLEQNQSIEHLKLFTPFRGVSSQCSFNSCYAKPVCQMSFQEADRCAQSAPDVTSSDSFVQEYLNYLNGYDLLSEGVE